jgi:hypothetical protein
MNHIGLIEYQWIIMDHIGLISGTIRGKQKKNYSLHRETDYACFLGCWFPFQGFQVLESITQLIAAFVD